MREYRAGDEVVIISVKHSGPAGPMPSMVMKKYTIEKMYNPQKVIIDGWIFDHKDIAPIDDFPDPQPGLFNINNLYLGESS